MNKNLYRIIFNPSRGQLMAVAENAGARGKPASGQTQGGSSACAGPLHTAFRTLSFCIALSFGVVLTTPTQAQIKADASAPRVQQPVILQTASGVPQVDIASPSAAGVSRNTFSQFDVQRPGVILNNSRANVLTQLGGYVPGNPMLATGSARVILNQINSANPSYINGYIEVAGQRAEVIIANPSGINVNGGGFINASRATLTTGTPIMNGGSLDGYLVQRGSININGAGLDATTTDYTGILARAVQVNAGIWAKELKVVAGANQINEAQTTAAPTTGTGPAPGFAIDVAQLGGMYAGKITLIGTEAGVGVRNAGVIGATAGDVLVQSNGWLSSITNAGTVYSAGNTSLTAQGNITNTATGLIAALGNTSLAANGPGAQVITQAGSVLAAGLKADGSLATTGDLSVTSNAAAQLKGQFVAGGGIALTSASLDLSDITLAAPNASLSATTGDVDLSRSTVSVAGTLAASAAQTLRTDGAAVTANQLAITARNLSNVAGQIIQTGTGSASISLAGNLNNTSGRIATNAQNLTLAAQTLTNTDGKLEHAGTGAFNIGVNAFNGQRGQLISNGVLVMNSGNFNLDNASTAASQITINAASLSNRQGNISQTGAGPTSINTTGSLDNTGGKIQSNGAVAVNTAALNNTSGVIASAQSANITAAAGLINAFGTIQTNGAVLIKSAALNNTSGVIISLKDAAIAASQGLDNTSGRIQTNGAVAVNTAALNNTSGVIASAQSANITAAAGLNNTAGTIETNGALGITTTVLSNVQGSITSMQDASIAASAGLDNTSGKIQTNGAVTVNTRALNNTTGTVGSVQNASIVASEGLDNTSGKIQTNGTLAISTTALNNTSGTIASVQDAKLGASQSLNNTSGTIQTNGAITVNTRALNNTTGTVGSVQNASIVASEGLDNTSGKIQINGTLAIITTALNNTSGTIASVQDVNIGASQSLNNTSGTIQTNGQLGITTAVMRNVQGHISSLQDTRIAASQGLDNTSGRIQTNGAVTVSTAALNNTSGIIANAQTANITAAAGLNNSAGTIETNGALGITTTSLSNVQGRITSMQDASITASQGLDNTSGKIQSNGAVAVNTTALNNTSGVIASAQTANITATAGLNNSAGTIETNGALGITTTSLTNVQGRITSMQDASIAASAGLDNTAGAIESNASLAITAQSLTNQRGRVQALSATPAGTSNTNAGNVSITSQGVIDNSAAGRITSGGDVRLAAQELNNSLGFVLAAGSLRATVLQAANNAGGQMAANGNVQLTASSLDNTRGVLASIQGNLQTTTTGQTINNSGTLQAAQEVSIAASGISNSAGSIAGHNVTLTASSGGINNSQGLISATRNATVQDSSAVKTLSITNTAGTIIAGQRASINAASLSGDGKVQSLGDVSVALTSDFTNQSELVANNNLTFSTTGDVVNSGKLQAGNDLSLTAQNITNAATGEITGNITTVTAANNLANRGLIDGQTSRINAPTLVNIGTGRIYGDDLSIAAISLSNDAEAANGVTTAAVIAARNRLDIGATKISNSSGATLLSVGDMFIGGALDANGQATGRASVISNHGATLQAMGSLSVAAQTIHNTNAGFAYAVYDVAAGGDIAYGTLNGTFYASQGYVSSTGVMQYYATDGLNRPTFSLGAPVRRGRSVAPNQGSVAGNVVYNVIDYTTTVQRAVVTSTNPGIISSGSAMALDASSQINNDMSQILAGTTLGITGSASINNVQNTVATTSTQRGSIYTWENFDSGGCGGLFSSCARWTAFGKSGYYNAIASSTTLQGNYQSFASAPAQGATTPTGTNAPTVAGPGTTALAAVTSGPQNTGSANTAPTSQLGAALIGQLNPAVGGLVSAAPGSQVSAPAGTPVSIAAVQVRTSPPGAIKVPNSALYRINTNPANTFVVQTDPRFTNLRQWLSSDYMLQALNTNPSNILKRLGDGFYEQRLINEQIGQLTGRRFLGNFTSQDQQYKSLMDSGITYAKAFNLRPGIALSEAQMAQLTSDIVWLVEQAVTLPDGSTVQALVPQVYVANIRPGDMDGSGALLSAQAININIKGDVNNSGNIGTSVGNNINGNIDITGNLGNRTLVTINAANINNLQGSIQASQVSLNAINDITNIGGAISAGSQLGINAGRDIKLSSTTTSNKGAGGAFTRTQIDRLAGVYVVGLSATPGSLPGSLSLTAGRDINAQAAVITNTSANGNTNIQAAKDIRLSTVTTDFAAATGGGANYMRMQTSQDVGSAINSNGNLTVSAGNNLNATAATLQSSQGATQLTAGNNVSLLAGQKTSDMAWGSQSTSSGFLSSSTTTRRETGSTTQAVGTTVGGNNVNVTASKDINIKGSTVIADKDATLKAGNNVNIEAATNTSRQTSFTQKTESGLLSGGGLGITYGKREQSLDQKSQSTTAASSTIGAISGNINIQSGQAYKQVGSDLIAPAGDINITAKKVEIVEARETTQTTTEQKFKQSGLTVSLSNPVISAISQGGAVAKAASQTSDGRMQALAAASTGLSAYNTYGSLTDKAGNFDAKKASDINLNVSIGSSKSQSNSSSQSDTARGSIVGAGNSINITATGAGAGAGADKTAGQQSDVTIQGSSVKAGNNTTLAADNNINLLAAKNESSQTSTNSSSSGSVGVSYGVFTGNVSVNASASKGKGSSSAQDTRITNTDISAGNTATIKSGGDTNLIGATVQANQIKADIGGSLKVESLQDKSSYTSNQKSMGASISIPITVSGSAGGSVSASKSSIDSNFQSVGQQSGLKAGDGGFQVSVNNNTALKGGVIASTQQAINDNKNTFTTGGALSITDVQNTASFKGTAVGGTIGVGSELGKSGAGVGNKSGNAASTSSAGISGIAGNTAVRTGDAETGLKPVFDADKVQREINAQVAITTAFTQQAGKAVGDYAGRKLAEAEAKKDQAEIDKWKEGGSARVALHALIGALTGNVAGALGAGASQAVIPYIADAIAQLDAPLDVKQALIQMAGGAIGAVAGGAAGVASALTLTSQNYLTHTDIRNRDKKLKGCQANGDTTCEVKVLKDYDLLSAKNTGAINYNSVLSETALQAEKIQLERLINDPTISAESKAQAQRSINELSVAINVIQKSPVLKDAAQLGLVVADVVLLGQLAAAKVLTSTVVREYVLSKTGKEITPDAATVIANNFYREGAAVEYGGSRVITNPNEAVFWSGRTGNVGGVDAAKTIADQYKGRTLEQLIETRQITMPMYDPNVPASVQAWQSISTELAKNASGEVRAVLGAQMRPQSIWETYELPTLLQNAAVTRIVAIDPVTLAERVIFQRGLR